MIHYYIQLFYWRTVEKLSADIFNICHSQQMNAVRETAMEIVNKELIFA